MTHRRQRRNTCILVGVVGVLGAAAIADQLAERMRAPKPLLNVGPQNVHTIVLECEGCARVRIERVGGRWRLEEPFELPASPERVAELFAIANADVRHRRPASDFEPAKIGLVPPYAVLKLAKTTLEFGATEPLYNDRYVRVDDRVALVRDRYSQLLRAPPEAFVDPRPFAALPKLAAVRVDDVALPPEAVEQLKTAVATQVLPSASGAMGAKIVAAYGTNRSATFTLVTAEDGPAQLVREDPVVVYVLDEATAALLKPVLPPDASTDAVPTPSAPAGDAR